MNKTKCVSCGNEFEGKKEQKKVKVTLSNPGDVFCEGNITVCSHCKEEYVEEEDIMKLAESFDKAHYEKYHQQKKQVTI